MMKHIIAPYRFSHPLILVNNSNYPIIGRYMFIYWKIIGHSLGNNLVIPGSRQVYNSCIEEIYLRLREEGARPSSLRDNYD